MKLNGIIQNREENPSVVIKSTLFRECVLRSKAVQSKGRIDMKSGKREVARWKITGNTYTTATPGGDQTSER